MMEEMSVQENEPRDLMASGLGGSGLSTQIKEPLLANYFYLEVGDSYLVQSQSQKSVFRLDVICVIKDE